MQLPTLCNYISDSDKLIASFKLDPDLIWFKGHFEDFPIFPAVAQLYMVKEFAVEYGKKLGLEVPLLEPNARSTNNCKSPCFTIQRMKFVRPMRPEELIVLTINIDVPKRLVKFNFSDSNGKEYSTGKLKI